MQNLPEDSGHWEEDFPEPRPTPEDWADYQVYLDERAAKDQLWYLDMIDLCQEIEATEAIERAEHQVRLWELEPVDECHTLPGWYQALMDPFTWEGL